MSTDHAAALRVVIAGGGTGGHVFPALALAAELTRGPAPCELLLVGSAGGLEERLVPEAGHRLELLEVGKLKGKGALGRIRTLARLPLAVARSVLLLKRFAPDVVVGVGGFASGPIVLAAGGLRLPVLLLEQNSIPGFTNRLLSRLAEQVVLSFATSARHFPPGRSVLLGNPVRPEILAASTQRGRRAALPPSAKRRLLVLGGSQGARAVNEVVTRALPALAAELVASSTSLRVVHQTGPADASWVEKRYREARLPQGVQVEVHAFLSDMASALVEADLVIGRAGATTLAELAVVGVPAVLVPYPYAADDHQAMNASCLAEAGGALAERQDTLTPERLASLLANLLLDEKRLGEMASRMSAAAFPDAARATAALVREAATRRARSRNA